MDVRTKNHKEAPTLFPQRKPITPPLAADGKQLEYHRTYFKGQRHGQGHSRRMFPFSIESLLLLVCLTASLLILPLILPPLPPPPFMLLLLPIGILAVLMILAFMPSSDVHHITTATYTYM